MTKKDLKILSFSTFLCVGVTALIISSCEKDNSLSEIPDNYGMENGIVEFKDNNDMLQTIRKINEMTETEYSAWQVSRNFVSLRTKLDDIYRQLNDEKIINDEKAVMKIITDNQKWIELITDEYGELCAYPIIKDKEYSSVLNIDGVCILGSRSLKIIGNYIVTAPKTDISELIATNSIEKARLNNDWEIFQYKYPLSRELKSTDVSEIQASYTKNGSHCTKARRVFIQMALIHEWDGFSYHTVSLRTRLTSERKLACVWVHYWTSMEARNVSGSGKCWSPNNNRYYSGSKAPFGFESDGDQWSVQRTFALFNFTDTYPVLSVPEFISAHGEATSRGVDDNWAILNYP